MDKTFQTKEAMFVRFDWDINHVYFFQGCSQRSSLYSCWVSVLSSNLEYEVISQTSVIYLSSKKHMPYGFSFFFIGSLISLIQLLLDEYAWAVETGWTWSGETPSVERGFKSPHPYFFLIYYLIYSFKMSFR